MAENRTILAFDVGTKRTGVAVGNVLTGNAEPAGQLPVNQGQFNWVEVEKLLAVWQPKVCVIGDPQTEDSHLNKVIKRLRHFLQTQGCQVISVDERLSSEQSNQRLATASDKLSQQKKTELRDQIAACIILERYFDSL